MKIERDPTMYCRDCDWSGPASARIKIESEPAYFIACGPDGSRTGYGTRMRNHCPKCNGSRLGMTPTEDWQRRPRQEPI